MSNQDYDRFNLPVVEFLTTLLGEAFPALNVTEGSAIHDLLVRPAAYLLQPHRDYVRLMMRNLKLANFQVMDEAELDALASNFLVSRRDGARARGLQRVFYARAQPTVISVSARFLDIEGRAFTPTVAVSATLSELQTQVDAATGQYYLDVPVAAEQDGVEYEAAAGTVSTFQGVVGAVRTTNPRSFTAGKDRDSNTELYQRILGAVVNRDLVKAGSLRTTLLEEFPTIRAVQVVGFGDPEMTRDVVRASLAAQELFRVSFCKKYNLPLNASGAVEHYEADGVTPVLTPVGGRVGAVVDALDIDFYDVAASLDGVETTHISIQPGFRVRLYGSDGADPDIGDYVVTKVLDAPLEAGGDATRVLLLDRPLNLESDPADAVDKFPYTVIGSVASERFHVGGKVDVYVDSTADVEKEVIISTLVTDENGVAEVPLTASATLPSGVSLFEGSIGFTTPVVTVLKVEELSFTADVVVDTLTPDTNYVVVRQENRSRYTLAENDVLAIRGRRDDGTARYAGSRLRVTYLTNSDYAAVQTYLSDSERRDVTKSVLVRTPQVVLLDVDLSYRGELAQADAVAAVTDYVAAKGFGAEITVNELLNVLAGLGVSDVSMPVLLTRYLDLGTGETEVSSSQDRLQASRIQVFRVVPNPSMRRTG